jgi:urease accessory protein
MRYGNGLLFAIAALALSAGAADAHIIDTHGAGLAQGFAHPFGGLDHLLAMVAVGLWAAQLGGRALWAVPAAFIAAMAAGGIAGALGAPLPHVELGIAGSLIVLGALVLTAARLPVALSAALVGLVALFHGHVHGAEMPEAASALAYGLGFVGATALLHAAGVGAGLLARSGAGAALVRLGGAGVAAAGLVLLAV